MKLGDHIISLDMQLTPEAPALLGELTAEAESAWPALLKRLQEQSRLSGLEVKYDLSMFATAWSPLFRHDSDHPVAWVHNATRERREGAAHPEPHA